MWVQNSINLILAAILCEAIVNLIFNGGVLQPAREFARRLTPFLSVRGEHLLDCKLCTSFWVGLFSWWIIQLDISLINYVIYGTIVHRLSNWFHLGISIIRDRQLDIRVNRNK